MFGRKRPRVDEAADVRQPIAAMLRAVLEWRDPCGRAYKVVHKVELSADRAVLRVGKFDRVTRDALRRAEAAIAGRFPYSVGRVECALRDRTVAITLVKRGAADEALTKRMRRPELVDPPSAPPTVAAEDADAVTAVAGRVLAALGEGVSWRALRRPGTYHLLFTDASVITDRALDAAGEASYVDYEAGALVAVVPRITPDIVC